MRFFSDGPSIPDQLLERRDQGRVVFLCGAGVSRNAGMPNFYELTKHVIDFFDPPEDSAIALEFKRWEEDDQSGEERPKTPLDQIFHLLHQEYGREEVNALVAERLQVSEAERAKNQEHTVIARISSDQEGRPQIVTTNFDLLFEQVLGGEEREIYEPPAFPDIRLGLPLRGITYLHGRLQEPSAEQHSYVLSSADFGRAYLSEGWATNFIRSLLKSYTVVLIGYQAEDPPVKYLLQGLYHDELSERSNLYAFDEGEPEDIEAKWRDRGVTAIACKDYTCLWRSLEAWAGRADNPRQWRFNVIDMAMTGPRQLLPHERGQVAHLVRSTPGARLFARTDPPPPAEWLCVFDAECRVAKVSKEYGENAEVFDPFAEYGLDDDPPRPSESDKQSNCAYDHILEWRRGDTNPQGFHRLSGRQLSGLENMPPRLFHLASWIVRHIDSPTAAWWAARQRRLHPLLVERLQYELRRNTGLHPEARHTWHLILEHQSDIRNFAWDNGWYEVKDRIKHEGWTPGVLRHFEAVTAPILAIEQAFGIGASKPPSGDWGETGINGLARWKIKFPDRHGDKLDVPDEVLESVFRITEGHFHRAAGMLDDSNTVYFEAPTCYPEREVEGRDHDYSAAFKWFLALFALMVAKFPDSARSYAAVWPVDEKYYFRGLKLFALNHGDLFKPDEAAANLLAFSQESFWDVNVSRELLFLVSDRWEGFSEENRVALAERLLAGPDQSNHWSDGEYPVIRDEMACRYTRWLTLQGRSLAENQEARLNEMISGLPEWNEAWAATLTEKDLPTARAIGTDETPDTIINYPAADIVARAQAESGRGFDRYTDKRPFTGLVKANPRKALLSLAHSARIGKYPQEFWSTLISDWPEGASTLLFRLFLHRLCRLPYEAIRDVRYPVGRWLDEKLLSAVKFDKALAWDVFDHLVSGLISDGGVATGSGIGQMRRGGEVIERSRRTIEYAINGPIGHAMQGLHHVLDSLELYQGAQIPEEFKWRIERLIAAPGEGGDHAIAILTRQISWLYYLDPAWVINRVIPWFKFDHTFSEPAWNGYLSAASFPPQDIGVALKPLMLELFPRLYQWRWGQNLTTIATQMVVEFAVFRSEEPDGLSKKEARHCLRKMNHKNRQDAVFRLGVIGQRENDGWSEHVIPFINTVWPRERTFRTSNLVSSWISLLDDTGENFPVVLSAVRRFLVPVVGEAHWLYQFSREVGGDEPLTENHPADVLALLDAVIPDNSEDIPYELAQILSLIEENDPTLVSDRRFVRLINLIEQT